MHYNRLKEEHLDPAIHIYIYIHTVIMQSNRIMEALDPAKIILYHTSIPPFTAHMHNAYIDSPFYSTHNA